MTTHPEEPNMPETPTTTPIVPILGQPDGDKVWTMPSTIRAAIGAASVCWSDTGEFQEDVANRIADELMANVDAYADQRITEWREQQAAKSPAAKSSTTWHPSPTEARIYTLGKFLIDEFAPPPPATVFIDDPIASAMELILKQRAQIRAAEEALAEARLRPDARQVFASLTAAVTDTYVSPDLDTEPRERWSRLGLAHQRAELYLAALGVPIPDAEARRIAAALVAPAGEPKRAAR